MLKRFVFLFICLSITTSTNSFMIPLTVEELTVESDTIISGEVTHILSYLDTETKLVYSKITIKIEELLWGEDVGTSCEIRILGGSLGDIVFICFDYPQFELGDQAVFFLSKDMQSTKYHLPAGKQAVKFLDNLDAEQKKNLHLRINKILQLKKE